MTSKTKTPKATKPRTETPAPEAEAEVKTPEAEVNSAPPAPETPAPEAETPAPPAPEAEEEAKPEFSGANEAQPMDNHAPIETHGEKTQEEMDAQDAFQNSQIEPTPGAVSTEGEKPTEPEPIGADEVAYQSAEKEHTAYDIMGISPELMGDGRFQWRVPKDKEEIFAQHFHVQSGRVERRG